MRCAYRLSVLVFSSVLSGIYGCSNEQPQHVGKRAGDVKALANGIGDGNAEPNAVVGKANGIMPPGVSGASTTPPATPSPPTPIVDFALVSPAPKTSGRSTLTWQAAGGADAYDVELASDAACTKVVQTFANIRGTSQVLQPLAEGDYFACITAKNAGGVSKKASNSGYAFRVLSGWTPMTSTGAPYARLSRSSYAVGSHIIIFGGWLRNAPGATGAATGRYAVAEDKWLPLSSELAPSERTGAAAVAMDGRFLVWGGKRTVDSVEVSDGAVYDDAKDAWRPTSGAGAPSARSSAVGVWTGKAAIVWGGIGGSDCSHIAGDGAAYDPVTDVWHPISAAQAPSARYGADAVWTGSKLLVWGGESCTTSLSSPTSLLSGAAYDPQSDKWSPISSIGAPSGSDFFDSPVWAGDRMLLVSQDGRSLAAYDPVKNLWSRSAVSTGPKLQAAGHAWTGERLVQWGATFDAPPRSSINTYDPATDTWAGLPNTGAPSMREVFTSLWTGDALAVWGGINFSGSYPTSGGLYYPPAVPPGPHVGPGAFNITAPLTEVPSDQAVTITWQAAESAKTYDLLLDPIDSQCNSPTVSKLAVADTMATFPAIPSGTYYVCILGKNAANQTTAATNSGLPLNIYAHVAPEVRVAATRLSQTGLFMDVVGHTKNAVENRPYTPQYPFYSSGAAKDRFISIPHGTKIDTTDMDNWIFPQGTAIWKELGFDQTAIETRMLVKTGAGTGPSAWYVATFRWRADGSDADLVPSAGQTVAGIVPGGGDYQIPSQSQCAFCHGGAKDFVIGFSALQLQTTDTNAFLGLNMAELAAKNLITAPPAHPPHIAGSATDQAALGYFHGNCGHCHNAARNFGGLKLRHEGLATNAVTDEPAYLAAVNHKAPNGSYFIKGGDAPNSLVIQRMTSPNAPMPPLGTTMDSSKIQFVLSPWINALPVP